MEWLAQAPANIALIKYMGKQDKGVNIAANPSLSYTLPTLLSTVIITTSSEKVDRWMPLLQPDAVPFVLSTNAQQRFLTHLSRLKQYFHYDGSFIIRSANNFPGGSGLASSASSFAALTKCAVQALCELKRQAIPSVLEQANLSQLGSGSSCRSFFAPWALWQDDRVQSVTLPYHMLVHQVIITDATEKLISSSDAHLRVKTSVHYPGRATRAKANLIHLLDALKRQDWALSYQICWDEFQDMHALFATCKQPFSYINEQVKSLLKQLQQSWHVQQDGPIVTMDAGPNIHLLYRPDQIDMAQQFKKDYLIGHYHVL